MESQTLAKMHVKTNNLCARRTMSSALENVTKMVHGTKIKATNYIHLYSFWCLVFLLYKFPHFTLLNVIFLICISLSNIIFDIEYKIVWVHSDIGLGQSEIRRTYLSIRHWTSPILDSPYYISPIWDWTYVLCFIQEWPEKMSVQCLNWIWTWPNSELKFA